MSTKVGIVALLLMSIAGCHQLDSTDKFVARVGDSYLLPSDIEAGLANLAAGFDTTKARSQIINQWINSELLYQEARRLRLSNKEDIQRRLDESERAVLIEGMISEYHSQADEEISQNDIEKYYERNKEHLRFFEPFVHIRYLNHPSRDSMEMAVQLMGQEPVSDSVFASLVERFSSSPDEHLRMTQNHFLETRLFLDQPELIDTLRNTEAGTPPQLILADSVYHLLQVIDRSAPNSIPELSWIEDFIREQLTIRFRKQNYTRSVQLLRLEAELRDEVEIR